MPVFLSKKNLLVAGFAAFLLVGALYAGTGFWGQEKDTGDKGQARPVPGVKLMDVGQFQEQKVHLQAIGKVKARQEIKIRSQLSGNVKSVHVDIGDRVEKGDLLVELEHGGLTSQLQRNQASIERLRNEIAKMKAGASKEQVAQASSSLEQAKAGLEQAKAKLAQTKANNRAMIENARIGVAMASSTLSNQTTSTRQKLSDAYDNLKLTSTNLLNTIRTALTAAGNILGEEPGEESANDNYEDALGALDKQTKRKAEEEFAQAKKAYHRARGYHDNLSASVSVPEGRELDDLVGTSLDKTDQALNSVRTVLDETVTSQKFPQTALNGLKQTMDKQISYINQAQSTLQAQRQAVEAAELSLDSTSEQSKLNYRKALQNLENAKQRAESNLNTARSAVQTQEKALAQARAAYQEVTASPREVDLAPMRSSIKELKAGQQGVRDKLDKAYIRAPFAGEIGSVPVSVQELVNPGDAMVSLVNKSGLEVRAYISPKDRKYVQVGAEAGIGKRGIPGSVSHVSPEVDSQTRKVEVVISVNEKDSRLLTGEYVETRIRMSGKAKEDNVYFLPFRAVKVDPQASYVFVVNDKKRLEKQEVELGRIVNEYNKVNQGLAPDMRIVADARGLEAGQKVKIRN